MVAIELAMNSSSSKLAAGKTKKKLVKVEQGIIDRLMAQPKRESCGCYACCPGDSIIDALALAEILEAEEVEAWRADYAATAATFQKMHDQDDDILKQYLDKGYAVVEVDMNDPDEEGEDDY